MRDNFDLGLPLRIEVPEATDDELSIECLVPVFPGGEKWSGVSGVRNKLTEKSVRRLEENFRRRGRVKIDFEHGSVNAPYVPGAGEFVELITEGWRERGIWAKARLNKNGYAAIKKMDYSFGSPYFAKEGDEPVDLMSYGLVSIPDFPEMGPIELQAASFQRWLSKDKGVEPMDERVLQRLGLPASATADDVLAKVDALLAEAVPAKADAVLAKTEAKSLEEKLKATEGELISLRGHVEELKKESLAKEVDSILYQAASVVRNIDPAETPLLKEDAMEKGVEWLKSRLAARRPLLQDHPGVQAASYARGASSDKELSAETLDVIQRLGGDVEYFKKMHLTPSTKGRD